MLINSINVVSNLSGVKLPPEIQAEINCSLSELFDLSVPIRSNYYDSFAKPVQPIVEMRLGDYLNDQSQKFQNGELCAETPLPKQAAKKIILKTAEGQQSAVALVHAGRQDCIAQVHFDWDHDYILHVGLSGQKTFFFFPPEASWLLNPIVNTSALCVPRFSDKDQLEIIQRLGGYRITIKAGQAVFFPSWWWHSVKYDQASIGISLRFNQPTWMRPFAVLPRSWWLQRLIDALDKTNSISDTEKVLTGILKIFFQSELSWQERYKLVTDYYRKCLSDLGQESGSKYWIANNFNSELALASFELESLYTLSEFRQTEKLPYEATEVGNYLFGVYPSLKDNPFAKQLVEYAFTKRVGLPIKRGLTSANQPNN